MFSVSLCRMTSSAATVALRELHAFFENIILQCSVYELNLASTRTQTLTYGCFIQYSTDSKATRKMRINCVKFKNLFFRCRSGR